MMMKSRLLNAGLIACALLMTLSGCSTDETVTDEKGTEAKSMKITVSDGNFTSAENSAAKTRATDTESGTSFTSGDAIGVFVVKSDGTLALTNAKYTYNGSKWLNSSNNEGLLYSEGATYFAYYPYKEDSYMTGTYDATKATATDFFATLISGWTPTTDQSTQALFTAQDLMVSAGNVDATSHSCTFTMDHQMSMIEMDLAQVKYSYNGVDSYKFTFGDTYKPFNIADGKYRLIIKPATSFKIVGDNDAHTRGTAATKWHISATSPALAKYKVYKYQSAAASLTTTTEPYIIHGDATIGNYLYADGTNGTEYKSGSTVGIIFSNELTLAQYNAGCRHGKAIALNNANSSNACHWANADNSPYTDQTVHPYCKLINTCYDDISSGYDALSANSIYVTTSTNEAWNYCYTYKDGTTHSGSLEKRNWYLPSMGEWWDVMENLGTWTDTQKTTIKGMHTSATGLSSIITDLSNTYFDGLNTKLTAASGSAIVPDNGAYYFWSASEYDSSSAVCVCFASKYVSAYYDGKANYSDCVRAVLAY
jgi:uncharacterized protein (TIGR02145 family)